MFAVPIQDGTTVILNHSPQGGSRRFACLVEKAGESSTAGLFLVLIFKPALIMKGGQALRTTLWSLSLGAMAWPIVSQLNAQDKSSENLLFRHPHRRPRRPDHLPWLTRLRPHVKRTFQQ